MLTDPYFSTDRNVDRLLEQYKLHGKLIVAFDFDDTIYDYHKKGHDYPKVVELLKLCSAMGFTMIMFSTKEDEKELDENANYCEELGITEIWINCGPIMPDAKKPFYNIYLDDKAGLAQAYDILNQTVQLIKRQG
jgi:MoaA/NifB/PqqE/SkfB family radical SAM enzyme